MANTFKNAAHASVGTSAVTVYTVPSSTTSVVIGLNIANRSASQITADVQLGSTYIIKAVPIPVASSLSVLDGKIIMETTHTLRVTSSASSSADVILSVLEQS